jgi:hypothetical protein
MNRTRWMFLGCVSALTLAIAASPGWLAQEGKKAGKQAKVELPAAVAKVVKENRPNAEIDNVEVEKEAGITLYDIEFQAGQGEIEVAGDGTVMEIAVIVSMKDLPKGAAEAIQKAGEGAKIRQIEKSEVRAEIKKEGRKGKVNKLASPKFVYEADLVKGAKTGEIQVTAEGRVVEAVKWNQKSGKN